MSQTTPQVNYESVQSSGYSGLPKPNKLSSQKILWSGQSGPVFLMLLFIKNSQRYGKKKQNLRTSLAEQAKSAILGMRFSSQAYYNAWYILCQNYGRSDVIFSTQYSISA